MTSRGLAALRAKRCRQRRRKGLRVYPVPTSDRAVETLINLGWINEEDAVDRTKVGDAISAVIAEWEKHWRDHFLVTRDARPSFSSVPWRNSKERHA